MEGVGNTPSILAGCANCTHAKIRQTIADRGTILDWSWPDDERYLYRVWCCVSKVTIVLTLETNDLRIVRQFVRSV